MTVLELAMKAKCFPTESNVLTFNLSRCNLIFNIPDDAVRIITAGGFYVNHQRIKNINEVLSSSTHFLPNGITLIRVGKKNYYIVKWFL